MIVTNPIQPYIDENCQNVPFDLNYKLPPVELTAARGRLSGGGIGGSLEFHDFYELKPLLREAARTKNALEILTRASFAFFLARFPNPAFPTFSFLEANALTDLAATGREAYSSLKTLWNSNQNDRETVKNVILNNLTPRLTGHPSSNTSMLNLMIGNVLHRVTSTAWYLAANSAQRAELSINVGNSWLCISSEDDTPHSPVNVPTHPYIGSKINVPLRVGASIINIETRFFVAPSDNRILPFNPNNATLPTSTDICKVIPIHDEIIIYIHGHSSRAEEALEVIPQIQYFAKERGKNYTVISLDLPCCGYSSMIDHTLIAPLNASHYPYNYLMLQFIEDFIITFIRELNYKVTIRDRIACVMGGSLGGNMGLRLAERPIDIDIISRSLKKIVAYSPGSVWSSYGKNLDLNLGDYSEIMWAITRVNAELAFRISIGDISVLRDLLPHLTAINDFINRELRGNLKSHLVNNTTIGKISKLIAIGRLSGRANEVETSDTRDSFFAANFDDPELAGVIQAQPYYWYRNDWEPCKERHIKGAKIERREIYNSKFRQWHWRVALEQLLFSHIENDTSNGAPRYSLINKPLLLGASALDDDKPYIYSYTQNLANLATNATGSTFFLEHTGHSIHNERPKVLSHQVVSFLSTISSTVDEVVVALRFNANNQFLGTETLAGMTTMVKVWTHIDNPSIMNMIFIEYNKVRFKNYRNQFLTVNSDNTLSFNDLSTSLSQDFTIVRLPNGEILFKGTNERAITFNLSNRTFIASVTGVITDVNNAFTIINLEQSIPFKLNVSDGRILFMSGNTIPNRIRHSFYGTEFGQIYINFFLIYLGNNRYAIKSERGNYLREEEGRFNIIAHRTVIGIPEAFELIRQENGNYIIKTPSGRFLSLPSIECGNRNDGFTTFLKATSIETATQFYMGCGFQPVEPNQPPINLDPILQRLEDWFRELIEIPQLPPVNPLFSQALIEINIKPSILEKNFLQDAKGNYYFTEDFYSKLLPALWANEILKSKEFNGVFSLATKTDKRFSDLITSDAKGNTIYFKLSDEKSIPKYEKLAKGIDVKFVIYKYPFVENIGKISK